MLLTVLFPTCPAGHRHITLAILCALKTDDPLTMLRIPGVYGTYVMYVQDSHAVACSEEAPSQQEMRILKTDGVGIGRQVASSWQLLEG